MSFRTRVLLLVLAVAVIPFGLIGMWLTGSAGRSGETLLRSRLRTVLEEDARAIELAWVGYRSALLDLSETPAVQGVLRQAADLRNPTVDPAVRAHFASMEPSVEGIVIRDAADRTIWQLGRAEPAAGAFPAFGALLRSEVPLYDIPTGDPLGRIDALIPINALRSVSAAAASIGAVVTARDPSTGALLLPAPFDPGLLAGDRFLWSGASWITLRQEVAEPDVELIAAAPVAPFVEPFNRAARRGMLVLLLTTALALALATLVTARLTQSLEQLATAATDVAGGQLGRMVHVTSTDEVGRVASAFNAMSDSLRRTLDRLAERESLAAVNEFAAALAHEVRNPLTSIQLDLQDVEEQLPEASPLRPIQGRALEDIARLNRTVTGALETARTGHVELRPIDIREPITSAVRAAAPAFADRGAAILFDAPHALTARADPEAVERMILNLLLNAAAALETGGTARVTLNREDADIVIAVHDDGHGMPPDVVAKVFQPFFTTRAGGTGVGLAVARRIVTAHGGDIGLSSQPGHGTVVTVRLPAGTT